MAYNKYSNKKVTVDGITFDSISEANRYRELSLLQRAGKISELKLQPVYLLSPKTQYENKCEYIADFEYIQDGKLVVEDVKGCKTHEYIVKRKWFRYKYPDIIFKEIIDGHDKNAEEDFYKKLLSKRR